MSEEEFEFDEDTLCVYRILQKEDNLTSKRILELAETEEFKEICVGCVSGDTFLRAAKALEKAGYIKSSLKKGGYHWSLVETNK